MNIPASEQRGTCGECRHANQGTDDALEGFWACPWVGATGADCRCLILFKDTGEYVFERHDGTNCTWGSGDPVFRSVPAGYEDREVIFADDE